MQNAETKTESEAAADRQAYDKINALNWSRLRLLEKSPTHFQLGFGDDSSGFALGTAAHMAVLEPERFASEYEVTSIRRDARTKAWQEAETDAVRRGVTLLIQSEYTKTVAIRDAVFANPRARELLTGGRPEVALTWKLGQFDCKGRADYISPSAIIDLKSTQCSAPKAFGYSVRKYGYLGQAAWYSDGCRLRTGKTRPFYFVAVESAPPHLVTVFRVTEAQLAEGREQYLELLGRLAYCQSRNWWGGYTESPEIDLELPRSSGWSEE